MEFTVINDISAAEFMALITKLVGKSIMIQFTSGEIFQAYHCHPLTISVTQKRGYIKVMTGLENGWPFIKHVVESSGYTAMQIRYVKDSVSEFYRWNNGMLSRMQYALKDTKWIWYGQGDLQKWENAERYSCRIIKNRLTREILNEYLKACKYDESIQ